VVTAVQLDHLRSLNIRLLGDWILQKVAWYLDEKLERPDTLTEYVALTKLQADAFVTLDRDLAFSLERIVPLASIEDMLSEQSQQRNSTAM
jgi:hypothetical protein